MSIPRKYALKLYFKIDGNYVQNIPGFDYSDIKVTGINTVIETALEDKNPYPYKIDLNIHGSLPDFSFPKPLNIPGFKGWKMVKYATNSSIIIFSDELNDKDQLFTDDLPFSFYSMEKLHTSNCPTFQFYFEPVVESEPVIKLTLEVESFS